MEKAEFVRIGDYIKDWEDRLPLSPYDHETLQIELIEFYEVIKQLMDEAFETKDQKLRVLLAALEYKTRNCKAHIEVLLTEWN